MSKYERGRTVVVDDDEATRISLKQMLRLRGYAVEAFSSAEAALGWPGLSEVDAIIADVKMPGMGGEGFLDEARRLELTPPLIMITGHGDVAMAVRCLKAGAYDFVEKPFEDDMLMASIGRAVERTRLARESSQLRRRLQDLEHLADGRLGMIGRSRVMQDLYDQIESLAPATAPVLITGETGVGKELVARALHNNSPRAAGPFVAVNAGSLAESMLESELFGHLRGAFTGAQQSRDGKLIAASGGTLFLDELESFGPSAQVKLLRVLEDGEVYPVGGDKARKANIRLLTASKVDLRQEVESSRMRADFFHRIAVLEIHVPPLRERSEDLPLLIAYFLEQAAKRNGIPVPRIPEESLGAMLRHSWPGNIRELKNALERMTVTSRDGVTGRFEQDEGFAGRLLSLPATPGLLCDELERTERAVIESALASCSGEVSACAAKLGISRRALYERMKKYGLAKEAFR